MSASWSAELRTVAAIGGLGTGTALAAVDFRNLSPAFDSLDLGARYLAIPVLLASLVVIDGGRTPRLNVEIRQMPQPLRWFWAWSLWAFVSGFASEHLAASIAMAAGFGAMVLLTSWLRHIELALPTTTVLAGLATLAGAVAARLAGAEIALVSGRLDLLAFEANQLARHMGLAALAGIWLLLRGNGLVRLLGLAGTASAFAVLALSESRTGMMAFAVAIAYLLYRQFGRLAVLGGTGFGLLCFAGLAVLNKVDGLLFVFSRGNLEDLTSATGRTDVWPPFIELAGQSPILGYGLGGVDEVGAKATVIGELDFLAEHAHNLPLQVAIATGVVGLALAAGGVVSTFRRVTNPYPLAMLIFVLVDGLTEGVLLTPSFGWLALLIAAASGTAASGTAASGNGRMQTGLAVEGDLDLVPVIKDRAVPVPVD